MAGVYAMVRHWIACIFVWPMLKSSPSYKKRYVIIYTKAWDFEVTISVMETIGMTEYLCSNFNDYVDYNDELSILFLKWTFCLFDCEIFLYLPYQGKRKT